MFLRKWAVRILVFGVAAACLAIALVYQRWTDPAAVRQQIVDRLQEQFPGAVVAVDAARLRSLGGIVLTDLRLARKDDQDLTDIAHIPNAVLYHDKEHLLSGKLALLKIVMPRPQLRLVRGRDGRWNFVGLAGTAQ